MAVGVNRDETDVGSSSPFTFTSQSIIFGRYKDKEYRQKEKKLTSFHIHSLSHTNLTLLWFHHFVR